MCQSVQTDMQQPGSQSRRRGHHSEDISIIIRKRARYICQGPQRANHASKNFRARDEHRTPANPCAAEQCCLPDSFPLIAAV